MDFSKSFKKKNDVSPQLTNLKGSNFSSTQRWEREGKRSFHMHISTQTSFIVTRHGNEILFELWEKWWKREENSIGNFHPKMFVNLRVHKTNSPSLFNLAGPMLKRRLNISIQNHLIFIVFSPRYKNHAI